MFFYLLKKSKNSYYIYVLELITFRKYLFL